MKVLYTIIVVLFVLLVITFSLQNTTPVPLQYYDLVAPFPVPAYMLLFIAFLAGVIFTGLLGIVERFRLSRTVHRLNKTVRELRREIRAQDPVGEGPDLITDDARRPPEGSPPTG